MLRPALDTQGFRHGWGMGKPAGARGSCLCVWREGDFKVSVSDEGLLTCFKKGTKYWERWYGGKKIFFLFLLKKCLIFPVVMYYNDDQLRGLLHFYRLNYHDLFLAVQRNSEKHLRFRFSS